MTRLREALTGPVAWGAGVVGVLALLLGVGRLIPDYPIPALGIAGAVMLLGLTYADPTIVPLMSVPLLLVNVRLPLGATGLSISDVVLFLAFWPAVLFAGRPYSPPMRALVWLGIVYQVSTLFTVIANPFQANVIEWFHAGLLVVGALVVGWALGRAGRGGLALTLIMLVACVFAVSTIAQGLAHLGQGLQPVYPEWPYLMHKNFMGPVLAFAALIAYVQPSWMRWPRLLALSAFGLCVGGLLFTQSRQAVVGLAVALAVAVLRSDDTRRRSKLIILAGAAALTLVGTLVRDQLASANEHNSVFQRLSWVQDSLTVWKQDQLLGVGLRWWYTDRFPFAFQPPNAELEVMTTAGLLGLSGFLLLAVAGTIVLWRVDPTYGTLALAVFVCRFMQGQFDLFWVAVLVSVPFLIVGICLGQQAWAEHSPGARSRETPAPVTAHTPWPVPAGRG